MDSEFLITLRRLKKRDPTTKQKALASLLCLLHQRSHSEGNDDFIKSESVIASSVLPFWPLIYNSLVDNDDRRVRELAQIVMHALAKRLSRNLAPSLKEIVFSWTFATVDPCENTAKAAQAGLRDTFPDGKLGELYRSYSRYLLDEWQRRMDYLTTELPSRLLKCSKNKHDSDLLPLDERHHLDVVTHLLAWVTSILPELSRLPADSKQLARLHDLLGQIWPPLSKILGMANFAPLNSAYFQLLSVMCQTMTDWVANETDLLRFVISTAVDQFDANPDRMIVTSTCFAVFGSKVWRCVNWVTFVDEKLVPMVEQAQGRAQRQAVFTNLLPLVSQLPLDLADSRTVESMTRLINAARQGLLASLGLPRDANLRETQQLSSLLDQGASVGCLAGLLELSRFLVDQAALCTNEQMLAFLFERVFLDLISFAFCCGNLNDSSPLRRRWPKMREFYGCLFRQVCVTLAHLVRDPRAQLNSAYSSLRIGVTDLLRPASLQYLAPQMDPVRAFLDQLVDSGTGSDGGGLEPWCRAWLDEISSIILPDSPSCQGFAHRWLLVFHLSGHLDSSKWAQNALSLLLTSIIPAFDDDDEEEEAGSVFVWTPSMTRCLVKFAVDTPVSSHSWQSASERTRKNFISGPIRDLLQASTLQQSLPTLTSLLHLLVIDLPMSSTLLLQFIRAVLSASLDDYDEFLGQSLHSIALQLSKLSEVSPSAYEFLSALITLLLSNQKLHLNGLSELVEHYYVQLTLDVLWSLCRGEQETQQVGGCLVAYIRTLDPVGACSFANRVWVQTISKLTSTDCPEDVRTLVAFLEQLPIDGAVCCDSLLTFVSSTVSALSSRVESISRGLPLFLRPEGFPITLLSQCPQLLVALQVGFRLRLHKSLTPGSPQHKRLAMLLLTTEFWLCCGPLEPFTLLDISPKHILLPTNPEDAPSSNTLQSFIRGICSEVVDANYALDAVETNCAALRAALAGRLLGIHPLEWPLVIREGASCHPPSTWLEEQVTGSSPETFLRLCEVCLPAGVLRRCLPRSEVIAYLMSLTSKSFLNDNKEGLARLVEMIASLSSIAFVGSSYAMCLAPLTLDDPVRDALVAIEDHNDAVLYRAVVATMKALQMFLLLRQPLEALDDDPSRPGLVRLSMLLRQEKPRLTRDQWDSLLCLTAGWIMQAVARPLLSTPFPLYAFQLVASIGALFVNSLCSSTTVVGALLRRNVAQATSIDQLMNMNTEEWDATDFDFAESYDDEDDGSAVPIDFTLLDQSVAVVEDDVIDADYEELRFEDPNAFRRLAAPLSVQKDWCDFFAGNLYGCLIPLVSDVCLGDVEGEAFLDTPPHVAALCAAVSTASMENLLACLEAQPDIVANYLLDGFIHNCPPPQVTNNLFFSECLLAPHMRNALDLSVRFLTASSYQACQLLGHVLLTRIVSSRSLEPVRRMSDVLIPHIPSSWSSALTAPLPDALETILSDTDKVVSQWGRGAFQVRQLIGEDVVRGHQRLLAYLLAWDAIISLLSSASQQSRAGLQAALLADENWINHLCRLLLTLGLLLPTQGEVKSLLINPSRLEPDSRLLLTSTSRMTVAEKRRRIHRPGLVFSSPDRLVQLPGHRVLVDITHLAVRLLRRLLAQSPALMRSLYAELQRGGCMGESAMTPGQARQLAGHLERVVRRQFSADLSSNEVESIERRADDFKRRVGATPYLDVGLPDAGSVDIRGRCLSREVITTYHFATDQSLEMIITLPENFPLSPVTVEAGQKTGAALSNWRAWIIRLSVFINNQNGTILDGIGMWLRNLKKKFDGVEDCAICYSVIHDRNFSLPRMQCRVCKKRFHNDCMYRYFQTSRNPTCPLCRSLFYTAN